MMKPAEIDKTEFDKILLTIDVSVKYDLALSLVEATIPIWENYAKDSDTLSYFDGIGNHFKIEYQDESGNLHNLEKDIVFKTVQIIKAEKIKSGSQAIALQQICNKLKAHSEAIDIWDDWQPFEADVTLSAAHNLVQLHQEKFIGVEETKLNLIIWQAVMAVVTAKTKTLNEIEHWLRLASNNNKQPDGPDRTPNNEH